MRVEIWSDIACPWCYVGKRRFETALQQFEHADDVDVVWRSFELDPDAPRHRQGSQHEHLAKKYGMPVEQARAMNQRMTGEGEKEGIEFDFDHVQMGNTFDAHRLVHLAADLGRAQEMQERLMRAYFSEGEAIGHIDTLARLAAEVGVDESRARELLMSDVHAADVRADEQRARAFGISGVPFFAIDERYGVSGAQPAEVLLAALRQAHEEAEATRAGG
jgi:predicted DsbA family dithiol-disulfide isomerase